LIELVAGQNTSIANDNSYKLSLQIDHWQWGVIVGKGKTSALFNQEQGIAVQDQQLLLNLHDIEPTIDKITVYIAKGNNAAQQASLKASFNELLSGDCCASIDISEQIQAQTALTLLEIYLHKGNWKIRCVLQGYSAGLPKLLAAFGIADMPSSHTANVNINKPVVRSASTHENQNAALIELTWGAKQSAQQNISNYFIGDKFKAISDLRIGSLYQLNNSQSGLVYSFDKEFKGSFQGVPYIEASRVDDKHSERLAINIEYKHKLSRYLIFVSMMEAYDNWHGLNVAVDFQIPGLDRVVLSPDSLMVKPICAVAMLDFSGDEPQATPLNEYFNDLAELNNAFGWGLPFRSADDNQNCENNRDDDED
jgi:uncharacterized protein involved in tellurium resistance